MINYKVNNDEFIIKDYNNAKAFASFLPAIAGLWGKPLWVYYVNRGQAISNFGIKDKDGAMLEFTAANKAWRLTASQGFRTFYKIDGVFAEPFKNTPDLKKRKIDQTMYINSYSVRLVERNEETGIETEAVYYTLPNENFPALLRQLTIKNISHNLKKIECIDGMPLLIPWGTRDQMLKALPRIAEGWFAGVNYSPKGVPYYKLPVEPLDRPEVVPLHGTHFYCGSLKNGNKNAFIEYCIDPDSVFGRQMDFAFPAAFLEQDIFTINKNIIGKNKTPCAMGYFTLNLAPNESAVYHSMIGHTSDHEDADNAAELIFKENIFETKKKENEELVSSITSCSRTISANKEFDAYCAQNFIDNALRGGFPVDLDNNGNTYYAYSRVHGDMEREYNNFIVLPEYFSQGNGNYRDINQNRRSDIFFNRNIGDENIHFFMNLIQIDGFNPLRILGVRFVFKSDAEQKQFLDEVLHNVSNLNNNPDFKEKLSVFIKEPITIGGLFNFLEGNKIILAHTEKKAVLSSLLKHSKKTGLAEHGEGYWSDHWHYNTDLIENYLAIFPDRFEELMIGRNDYIFYDDCYFVEDRSVKYVLFREKPRQIRAVRKDPEKAALISSRNIEPNVMRTDFGKGEVYHTTLLGKLMSVIANKYASLDPEALGIEMESDKPNWCDALNGLPGIFGSSSAESLELLRLVSFLNQSLCEISQEKTISIPVEVSALLIELINITNTAKDDFSFWDQTHTAKENFREETRLGISGNDEKYTISHIREILCIFENKLKESRSRLEKIFIDGVIPTCFGFIPDSYETDKDADNRRSASAKARIVSTGDSHGGGAAAKALSEEKSTPIKIKSFKRIDLPLFLEGPVHYLRLCPGKSEAEAFHKNMLKSPLYDQKLGMIKVNAPITSAGPDLGRITVFTRGWLENESIWLHMEYKYLFELLRNGLAQEFFALSKNTLVPFFDPNVYGRSIFENSSFIVSSGHPDESLHGQGFVARLSGATAEFISIWITMTSGLKPFFMQDGKLCLSLKPCLPADYFTENKTFTFNFLKDCEVVYHNEKQKDTFGVNATAQVKSYRITFNDGASKEITGAIIAGEDAHAVREGKVKRIDAVL